MIADPLTIRELRGTTRRWHTYALRTIYIALITLVAGQTYAPSADRALQPSEYADLGRRVYHAFLALQVAFVTLAATWSASDSVLREVRSGTLGLLYLTPLTSAQVAFGKWKAAMAHALSLILCGAPVLAVCVFLGGAGPLDLAMSLTTTLGIAGVSAAFSFHFSSAVRSQTAVLGLSLAAMLGYSIAPLWFGMFGLFHAFAFVHPVYALGAGLATQSTGVAGEWGWAGALPASLATAWLLVRSSAGRLGRKGVEMPRPDDPGTAPTPALWTQGKDLPPREVSERHPLFWKEIATRAALKIDPDVRKAVAWIFLIFLVLAWLATEGRGFGMLYFSAFLAVAGAVVTGSSLFSDEKEGRRFDMLLSTPVSNGDIVRAKLAAGIASPEWRRAGLLILIVVVAWTAREGFIAPLVSSLIIALTLVGVFLFAAAASLFSPNARSAFLLASGTLFILLFLSPVLAPPVADYLHPGLVLRALEKGQEDLPARLGIFCAFQASLIGGLYVALIKGLARVTGRE